MCVDRLPAVLRGQLYSTRIRIGGQLVENDRALAGNLFTYMWQEMWNAMRLHCDPQSVKADINKVLKFVEKSKARATTTVPQEAALVAIRSVNEWHSIWAAELAEIEEDLSQVSDEVVISDEIALAVLLRISLRAAARHAAPERVGRIADAQHEDRPVTAGPQALPPKGHQLRKVVMASKLTASTQQPVPRGHGRRRHARQSEKEEHDADDADDDSDDDDEVKALVAVKAFPRFRQINRLVRFDRTILRTAGFAAESTDKFVALLGHSLGQPPTTVEQIASFISDGVSILATRAGPRKAPAASGSTLVAPRDDKQDSSGVDVKQDSSATASARAAPAVPHGTASATIQRCDPPVLRLDDIIVASRGSKRQRHEVDHAVSQLSLQHSRSCAVYPTASPSDGPAAEPDTLIVLLCPHSDKQRAEVDSFSGTQSVSLLCLHDRVRLVDAFPHLLSASDPEPSPPEIEQAVRWITWLIMQGGYAHVVFCGEKVQILLHKMLSQLNTGDRNAAVRITQRHEWDACNRFKLISVEVQCGGRLSKIALYEASHPSPRVTTARTNYAAMFNRMASLRMVATAPQPLPPTTRGPPERPWQQMLAHEPGTTTSAQGPWCVAIDPGNHNPLYAFVFKVNTAGALTTGYFVHVSKASMHSGARSSDCWRHDSIMWARPQTWKNRRWFGWSPHYRRAASLAVGRFQQLLTQSVSAADFLRAVQELNMGPSPHQHPPWAVQRRQIRGTASRCPLSFDVQDGNAFDRLLTYNTSTVRLASSWLHHSYPLW